MIGLALSAAGLRIADLAVALVVAVAIAWTAWRTIREASWIVTDAWTASVEQIAAIARSVPGVLGCHQVRAKGFVDRIRVDLHVTVAPEMSVAEAHRISEQGERAVRDQLGLAKYTRTVALKTEQQEPILFGQ